MDLQQLKMAIDRIDQPTLLGQPQHERRTTMGDSASLLGKLVLNSGGLQHRRWSGIRPFVFRDAVGPVQSTANPTLENTESL
jgi:hypothetical protein